MKHSIWLPAIAVLAAAGGTLAGACGDDDGGTTGDSPVASTGLPSGPVGTAVSGLTPPAGAPVMDQDDLRFKPSKLTVKAGEKVYVTNSESAIHTFNVNGKNVSGTMKRYQAFVWVAPEPGSYKITCDFHPQMNGTITVEAP